MGTYTECIIGCKFKKNTPSKVIDIIKSLAYPDEGYISELNLSRNPINVGGSYYFGVKNGHCIFEKDLLDKQWILNSRCNIKNYESDIEIFLEYIEPYIEQGSGKNEMYDIVICENWGTSKIYYLKNENND